MTVHIAALNLYPIKGCRGFPVKMATVEPTGLAVDGIGDREWIVVDADHAFLSQRELPRMSLIETRFVGEMLRLKAPGMLTLEVPFASEGEVVPVRVWNDTVAAVTQGEVADTWFTRFLGRPAQLVRFDPEGRRLADPAYTRAAAPAGAPYKFADAFPLLIANQASLGDLNGRLKTPVTMERFRPNIVLEGIDAFEEDYVKELRIDGVRLCLVKQCVRCTVPGVDPQTGEQSPEVPDTLATFRRSDQGVTFGVNAIIAAGASRTLRVGDAVDVELAF